MLRKKCWHRFGGSGGGGVVHFFSFWPQLSFLSRLLSMGFMDFVKYVSVATGKTRNVSFGRENYDSHRDDGWGQKVDTKSDRMTYYSVMTYLFTIA